MTTIYISGPMTGKPDLNFPAFHRAATYLRAKGYEVVNPAEFGEEPGMEWHQYLRKDIAALVECDEIYLLEGWQQSKGASLEVHIAHTLERVPGPRCFMYRSR